MENELRLQKLHGLGNDFLVALLDELPSDPEGSRLAERLCDRRRGIGADGLIFAVTARQGLRTTSARMQLWNSDGSRAEVSGNGLRCLTHAVNRATGASEIEVETVVGTRRCFLAAPDRDRPEAVIGTTELGTPREGPATSSRDASIELYLQKLLALADPPRWQTVDVGNPHIVIEVPAPAGVEVERSGHAVEALFSGGINVHFAAATALDELTLAIWERGAGATQACGSGAVAAAYAFNQWGEVGDNVTVRMAGGTAHVSLSPPVKLTGESVHVADLVVARA